jgi:photosystem II stability/assembly factor-like uncharacterized protein
MRGPAGGRARARLERFRAERGIGPGEESSYAAAYLAAVEQRARLERPTRAGWRPLGPFAIPHGRTNGSGPGSRPAVAGRVSAVAVDPGDPRHLLVGAAGGGVWESRDAGAGWWPRSDQLPSLAVGAIAFDPHDPSVAYAGTGDGDLFHHYGAGLLRSGDGGRSWRPHAGGDLVGSGFHRLTVDPADPAHLLAATTSGLYESGDGGTGWARRLPLAWDLSLSGGEVLAGCPDGLLRSLDGGTSWRRVALERPPARFDRVAVCHAPSDPAVAWVFAAGDGVGHLWRRDRADGPFAAVKPPADLNSSQAWYDWLVAVDPGDPKVVWLGALDLHRGGRRGGAWSWAKVSARPSGDSIPAGQHAIAFAPGDPPLVYAANDGGLYRSPDAGRSWRPCTTGLCIAAPERLAAHPLVDADLLAGTHDTGTIRYQGSEVWTQVADDPLPRPMAAGAGLLARAGEGVLVSADGGRSWVEVALPGGVGRASALAIGGPDRIWVGTGTGQVVRLDLAGGRWTATGRRSPRQGWLSDLRVDPARPERLWASCSTLGGGRLFRSDDGAASWTDRSGALPPVPVNAVELDPDHPDTVFVAADVGVYRSDDAGAGWASLARLLPNALATDLAFHRPTRRLRVALQSRGVWEIAVDEAAAAAVELCLRDRRDGDRQPTWWWQCPDLKLDAPPWRAPDAVDVAVFEDDRGPGAAGLLDQGGRVRPGAPARVYVQVHNRGFAPAGEVRVRVFAAPAAVGPPDLPTGFWAGFPDNRPPPGCPWQAVGPAVTLGALDPGRAGIAAFAWEVPAAMAGNLSLLAVAAAAEDVPALRDGPVAELVAANRACGLKSVTVVRLPARDGTVRALRLDLWGSAAAGPYALAADGLAGELVAAMVLSHPLAGLARAAGLEAVPVAGRRADLVAVLQEDPALAGRLELSAAFRPPAGARPWLEGVELGPAAAEPVVLLLAEPGEPGGGSLLQLAADGRVVGGHTLTVLPV